MLKFIELRNTWKSAVVILQTQWIQICNNSLSRVSDNYKMKFRMYKFLLLKLTTIATENTVN